MEIDTDKVFTALADGNRRKIIELIHEKDQTVLDLTKYFPFSFQGLSKHVNILESAQILNKKIQGKYRLLSINKDALKASLEWISYYSDFWNESFDKLDNLINNKNNDEFK